MTLEYKIVLVNRMIKEDTESTIKDYLELCGEYNVIRERAEKIENAEWKFELLPE